jgi:GxxExxY protein
VIHDDKTHSIIGAAMEVHRHVGPGHYEAVYQEALPLEWEARKIPYVAEPKMQIRYKGHLLKKHYMPDLLVFDGMEAVRKLNQSKNP